MYPLFELAKAEQPAAQPEDNAVTIRITDPDVKTMLAPYKESHMQDIIGKAMAAYVTCERDSQSDQRDDVAIVTIAALAIIAFILLKS